MGGDGDGDWDWDKIRRYYLFVYAEIWFMLMLMLKCCERKILFHGSKVAQANKVSSHPFFTPHLILAIHPFPYPYPNTSIPISKRQKDGGT